MQAIGLDRLFRAFPRHAAAELTFGGVEGVLGVQAGGFRLRVGVGDSVDREFQFGVDAVNPASPRYTFLRSALQEALTAFSASFRAATAASAAVRTLFFSMSHRQTDQSWLR